MNKFDKIHFKIKIYDQFHKIKSILSFFISLSLVEGSNNCVKLIEGE